MPSWQQICEHKFGHCHWCGDDEVLLVEVDVVVGIRMGRAWGLPPVYNICQSCDTWLKNLVTGAVPVQSTEERGDHRV